MQRFIKFYFVFCLLSFVFIHSCKKDKLKGKYENLVARWKWQSTTCYGNYPYYINYSVNSDTISDVFELHFLKKGFLYLYENGQEKRKLKVKINSGSCDFQENILCVNLSDGHSLRIVINGNSFFYDGFFPEKYSSENCTNVFTKIN